MDDIISTNLRMFFNLEYHKNRYQKFLHIGSGAVYDLRRSMEKVKEEDFLDQIPADLYGFSKYIIAKYIEKEPKFYDLRLFGIFGKYEDYTMRLISNLICNALLNNKLILNQNRIFDYLYIDDLITIMDFFIENEPHEKSYNLTPDHSISLLEIAGKIQNITQEKMPVEIKQEGLGLEYTGDNIRLKMFFPDIRFTSMDVAIQQLWNWYSNNKKMIHLMG
jgi:GDP-L-fucose synthase